VQLDGAELLGHHIVVERENLPGIVVASVDVNEDALRAMVKRLLSRVDSDNHSEIQSSTKISTKTTKD
jgi:hypothetical protein